ncbi:MAG: pantoate--beta-alanine ligase [Verrucomicrobiota bacterium]
MRILRTVSGIRKHIAEARGKGQRVALVPTMGALHEGHLRLVDLARKKTDYVVMSIYVNPTQFGPKEDFSKYPRTLAQDKKLAEERGVDVIFHPASLYYPDDSVSVHEREQSLGRCGASRPGHFDGVATVVAKLFNIVQPDYAVFGQKDGQQLDVIERLVRDMHYRIKIIRAPIIRDLHGLALSSRNAYLSAAEYEKAVIFAQALEHCAKSNGNAAVKNLRKKLADISGLRVDYLEVAGGRLYAAVKIGKTRLIDNRKIGKAH